MKLKRNYLTSEELMFIANEVCQHDNAIEREMIKIGLIAQLIVDDLGEFESCNDIYDKIMKEGIDLYQINNIHVLEDAIASETGIVRIIKDFVNDMSDRIVKSFENLDLNGAVKQLKEIADSDKIVEIDKIKGGKKVK